MPPSPASATDGMCARGHCHELAFLYASARRRASMNRAPGRRRRHVACVVLPQGCQHEVGRGSPGTCRSTVANARARTAVHDTALHAVVSHSVFTHVEGRGPPSHLGVP
eukprot:353424-Chlamydomonas_euryale.AAC.2